MSQAGTWRGAIVLVTGGTGHVGAVARSLSSLGHDVVAMGRGVQAASRRLPSGIACAGVSRELLSDALIHKLGEQARIDDELAPFGVVGCGGLGCDNLVQGSSLPLESGDVLADSDEHVAV